MCFYEALNSGYVEGEDVICPDPVLSVLISHGWFIPTEQQVSGSKQWKQSIFLYCGFRFKEIHDEMMLF